MHAPIKDSHTIAHAPSTPPDPAKSHPDAPRTGMHHNAPFCTTPDPTPLPTLTPTPAPVHPSGLSPKQHTAISLLCAGLSLTHAAAKLRIDRSTLFRWRTAHPAFRAELARRQHDLHDTAARRLRLTLLNALATVTDEIATAEYQEDRVKTALALLRHADLSALLSAGADDEPLTAGQSLDYLIRQNWSAANECPDRHVDDHDRQLYLVDLRNADAQDAHASTLLATPTHRRLRGGSPYPTPDNAPDPCPATSPDHPGAREPLPPAQPPPPHNAGAKLPAPSDRVAAPDSSKPNPQPQDP